MAFLLDTNVLSELRKGNTANSKVIKWAAAHISQPHFISVLSIGEIRKEIELLRKRSPSQCLAFERWLFQIKTDYERNLLTVSDEITERWGLLMAVKTMPVIDGLLAATALVHDLTIATRNVKDFSCSGVRLVNPWGD